MGIASDVVNTGIKSLTNLLCNIDTGQLARIPTHGPLILVGNHINFLDVPLLYTHLKPRDITGFAKIETWNNPALGTLFSLWGGIPLRRGEADVNAMRQALQALQSGQILGVAPEGTRSGDGCLGRGKPGVVILALHSQAPLQAVGIYGGELLRQNLSHLRRTDFHISVGEPFVVHTGNVKVTRLVRQQIADEIMYQIACLLPPAYRGYYADLSKATTDYLKFV